MVNKVLCEGPMGSEPVRCTCCGEAPFSAVDGVGLQVHAYVVWCEYCNEERKMPTAARGLTLARAVEIWNDNMTKAVQS